MSASSCVRARWSMRSRIADRAFLYPSHTIPAEMNSAAPPSSHHQPIPMPRTPTIEATVVVQSAFAMSASANRTLLCRVGASLAFAFP